MRDTGPANFPRLGHLLARSAGIVFLLAAGMVATSRPVRSGVTPREVPSPAGPGSTEPNLSSDAGGGACLSWLEPTRGTGHALRFSLWRGGGWSAPRTAVENDSLFVNWADCPAVVLLPGGRLGAYWLKKSGPGSYDYGVWLSLSADGGKTWTRAVQAHRDQGRGEHGFVAIIPRKAGGFHVFWLDGRKMAALSHGEEEGEGQGEMTLMHASLLADGTLGEESLLDTRTCECCPTGAALTSEGPIVVYRDRSEQEMRDISAVRWTGDRWSDPTPLSRDGWRIAGCPVNGPAVAASGAEVAVAWYSGAGDTARVRVAFSRDAGRSFAVPLGLDEGSPVGRVDVELLEGGAAVVGWVEAERETAYVKARRISPQGRRGVAVTVAGTSAARRSGFPRVARVGDRLLFAWTEAAAPPRVRTAMLRAADLPR